MRNDFLTRPSSAASVQRMMALFPLKTAEGFFALEFELACQYDELTKARIMARDAVNRANEACFLELTRSANSPRYEEAAKARAEAESVEQELNVQGKVILDKISALSKEQEFVLKQEFGPQQQAA